MKNYLETLIEEKGLNKEYDFNIEGNINLTLEVVIEFICASPVNIKSKIKDTLVKIDFKNGDVMYYFNHLAKGVALSYR